MPIAADPADAKTGRILIKLSPATVMLTNEFQIVLPPGVLNSVRDYA